jgi:hypothetical protein
MGAGLQKPLNKYPIVFYEQYLKHSDPSALGKYYSYLSPMI